MLTPAWPPDPGPGRAHRGRAALALSTLNLTILLTGCGPGIDQTAPTRATPAPLTAGPEAPAGALPLGAPCGGDRGACDAAGYCKFPRDAPCGAGDTPGVCAARPRGCRRDCPGACGCDGQRYCNPCVARARGHAIRHRGPCDAAAPAPAGPAPGALAPAEPAAPPKDPDAPR